MELLNSKLGITISEITYDNQFLLNEGQYSEQIVTFTKLVEMFERASI